MEKVAIRVEESLLTKERGVRRTPPVRCAPWLLLLVFCFAAAACLALYQFDNKYTYGGPQGVRGVLRLDEGALAKWPVVLLVEGWEYYAGTFLSPGQPEREGRSPDRYLYLGHYGGFEMGNPDASPHGSGSYRLVLHLPQTPRMYTLELPEIFSAYHCYIGGKLVAQMGDPDPEHYVPKTLNRTVSFEGSGQVELLIAVSDFSHFYSGMVYPPAFGQPEAVEGRVKTRLAFSAVLCALALFVAGLYLFIGALDNSRRLCRLYALTCLLFVCCSSYPIVKSLWSAYFPFYALEQVAYGGFLVCVMLLWRKICGASGRWSVAVPALGFLVCGVAAAVHLLLPTGSLGLMYAYSRMISAQQWLTAGYLTWVTIWTVRRQARMPGPLLAGIAAVDAALVMDRLLPVHEPILLGWFPQMAGGVLVLCAGVMVGQTIAGQYRKSAVLEEKNHSLQHFLEMQRTYDPMMEEKVAQAKTARHDLRHHLTAVSALADRGRYDSLRDYLGHYRQRLDDAGALRYCENEVADIIAHSYMHRAEACGIQLTLSLGIAAELQIAADDLTAVLSNLLENGVEACQRGTQRPFIALTARMKDSALTLRMENSFSEIREGPSGLLSSKRQGASGCGLGSIRTIARRYHGAADFQYQRDAGTFVSRVTMNVTGK